MSLESSSSSGEENSLDVDRYEAGDDGGTNERVLGVKAFVFRTFLRPRKKVR